MRLSTKFVSPKLYIHNWVALLLMVLLTLIAHPSHAQFFRTVPDRAESVTLPARTGHDVSPLKPRRAGVSPTPFSISIPAPSQEKRAAETAAVSPPGTPYKIGFGRDVPQLGSAADTAVHLQWQSTPQAGMIAAISISSSEAVGIRLGILVHRLPAEAAVRFYAQGAETAYEISGKEIMESIQRNLDAGDGGDAALTYWSPHIEGEEATLEIELPPGISADTVEISIPRVSHFFRSPLAAQGGNIINKTEIGSAASCEIDATCYSAWNPESNATAIMTFVENGNGYACTGTLLNDMASSGTPYFLSANHCISQQTVASTLQTYWFYRSASCNSGTLNPGYKTLSGGATLLYQSSTTDTSFMKLLSTPPAGATYAAWDSSAPALGISVTGIHHPKTDLQKISFGSIQSFDNCTTPSSDTFTCSTSTQTNGKYLDITFTSGITEPGSSGSGLFETSGGSHYLIGQLYGGDTGCSNPNGSDDYGRFDVAYNAELYKYLGATFSLSVSKTDNGSGTVTSAPSGITCGTTCSASFSNGTSVTLTATPASGSTFSGWSGACSGTGTSCSVVMNASKSVTATFSTGAISLGTALDNTTLVWTTGGNAPFTPQTTTFYYGGSAAQTGSIGNNQSTYLSTSVTGPGTLSFYWKVSSEQDHDIFSVYLDGVGKYYWSGDSAWYKTELTIPAGTHTIKWEYVKDASAASGQDAGWVDYVVFTPSTACTYTISPTSSSLYSSSGGTGIVAVTTSSSNCTWTAGSNASWITIQSGSSGSGAGSVTFSVSSNTGGARFGTISVADKLVYVSQGSGTAPQNTYYLSHIATGGDWRSLFTYVNSGTSSVNCTTRFYSDTGDPLYIPIDGDMRAEWSTFIPAKGTIHTLTDPGSASTTLSGWAICECSGPVKANVIFRHFNGSTPNGEGGVNAATTGATRFVTFAEKLTGIALTNPFSQIATVTVAAKDYNGNPVATGNKILYPGAHTSFNLMNFITLPEGFWGSVLITSDQPILSFALNFEVTPVFSALPPGEDAGGLSNATTYYLPHIATGGEWRSLFTYVDGGTIPVNCTTHFYSDKGADLFIPINGVYRKEWTVAVPAGGTIHTITDASATTLSGWAICNCSGPVKANLIFRHFIGSTPDAEGGVNAATTFATRFATFSEKWTGVVLTNPSASSTATVTVTAYTHNGTQQASGSTTLLPGEHTSFNLINFITIPDDFWGSIVITSDIQILSFCLNFEAAPVFSALPPGEN